MSKFETDEFRKDVKRQAIDDATVKQAVDKAWGAFMAKSTSQKMGALLWSLMLVIVRQHEEIKKLSAKGGGDQRDRHRARDVARTSIGSKPTAEK